ncbi:MAG: hypothetical protein POELPBGB_03647 [Bacteroidia bacterium]|nr:hypothetical protein [Bacteroidia bacterium]
MKNLFLLSSLLLLSFTAFSQTEFITPANEASYVGGEAAMYKYLSDKISEKINYKVGGAKVYTEFVISEQGEITDAKIIRGYDAKFDEVSLEAVKSMPKWNPATNEKGVAIKSKMVLPVSFQ